jgi:hypothetical protein
VDVLRREIVHLLSSVESRIPIQPLIGQGGGRFGDVRGKGGRGGGKGVGVGGEGGSSVLWSGLKKR